MDANASPKAELCEGLQLKLGDSGAYSLRPLFHGDGVVFRDARR